MKRGKQILTDGPRCPVVKDVKYNWMDVVVAGVLDFFFFS